MKRKITGTLLALLISGSSIATSASTVMGISSEYLPEIEEAVENEDPEDGGSETESIQQEQNVVSDTEETLAQGDSETEISENKQSGNFSENDKKTAEIFSEEEQQSGEEADFAVFSEENADLLTGNSEEAQELIQDIENGEMIAFSPALAESFTQTESAQVTADDNETLAVTALGASQYYLDVWTRVYCDEIWTAANDFWGSGNQTRMGCTYRSVHYVDDTGAEKVSPLYCLKATKDGVDSTTLKNDAVKVLKNSTVQKLLYFGYGGPGDLGISYDPSCGHINWSKWQNRYVFTHIALSKAYFNDCGYATETEVEHVGINRFLNKIRTLTIPPRNKAALSVYGENGWISATGQTIPLSVFRSRPDNLPYIPNSMKNGFQMSPLLKITDGGKAGNGIIITRPATATWQLAYWESAADREAHLTSPNMMSGTSLTLKDGARFYLIFPLETSASQKYSCKMLLQPVSYILVDGKSQTGKDGVQDFGAYVYQGTRGQLTFSMKPSGYGNVKITKTEANTGKKIAGAQYAIYAAEALKSGYRTRYKKDQRIEIGTTDKTGVYTFSKLIPGKYYVKEIKAPTGYLLSTAIKSFTVLSGKTTAVSVTDIMDISGTVVITKKDGDTGDPLAGAAFTLYEWSKKTGSYGKTGKALTYDKQKRTYNSEKFSYTEDNQGKFRIRETKAPVNYTGNWQKDIRLTEPGTAKTFTFEALNYQKNKRKIEIRKTDEETGDILEDAEFTLYEYSAARKAYKTTGTVLQYDSEQQLYVSEELLQTADNTGKFKITETRNPKGYEGKWEQEVDISDESVSLFLEVQNKKVPEYKGVIRLKKTDVYTGEPLTGAEFTVYQWNQEKKAYEDDLGEKRILRYDSDRESYYTEELLITEENGGKFRIVETKNPENYKGNYDKTVVFEKKEGVLTSEIFLQAENTPVILPFGTITVMKKIKEADIIWAHGNPTFFFSVEGTDLAGVSHHYEDYVTFVPDSYEVDENGYAVAAVTFQNIPLGQYTVWEKPVLRYYLKEVLANTENVRIVKEAEAAYGKDPKEIATGVAALTMENREASLTFVNEKARYDRYSHNDCIKNTIPLLFS